MHSCDAGLQDCRTSTTQLSRTTALLLRCRASIRRPDGTQRRSSSARTRCAAQRQPIASSPVGEAPKRRGRKSAGRSDSSSMWACRVVADVCIAYPRPTYQRLTDPRPTFSRTTCPTTYPEYLEEASLRCGGAVCRVTWAACASPSAAACVVLLHGSGPRRWCRTCQPSPVRSKAHYAVGSRGHSC